MSCTCSCLPHNAFTGYTCSYLFLTIMYSLAERLQQLPMDYVITEVSDGWWVMSDGAKVPVCLYSVNTPTHSTVYVITILVFCKLSAQNVYSTKSKAWRDNCGYHKIAVLHLTTMYFSSLNLFFLFSSLCVLLSPPCLCYSQVFLSPSCSCYSLTHRCCASPLLLILLFSMDSLSSSN